MTMLDTMQFDAATLFEDVQDIVTVMRKQEMSHYYQRCDYLSEQIHKSERVVCGSWRQKIAEWSFSVVDHSSLRRDSVLVATYYLDMCVMKGVIKSEKEYQIAAMTALQLAIKLYDSTMVKLDSMVKLGNGLFSEKDIIAMEDRIIKALDWHLHPPTPVCFLQQFLRLLPPSVCPLTRYMIAEITQFISEISVCLYRFVKYPPSIIAYAGMLISMDRIDKVSLPIWQRQQIFSVMASGANLEHTSPEVIEAVTDLQVSIEKSIKLKEHMDTIIGSLCHDGYTNMRSNKYISNGGMNSPRHVIGRACK
jgi:hypothetical protein